MRSPAAANKVDSNQPMMVAALRHLGYSVAVTSAIGKGFPDIVVGYNDANLVVEIKDPGKPPSKRKLTDDEEKWQSAWRGSVIVAETTDDVDRWFRERGLYP